MLHLWAYHYVSVKSLSRVRLFVTPWTVAHQAPLSNGIFQARVLEWDAISFSRGSSRSRDWTWVSHIAGRRFTIWATTEVHHVCCYLCPYKPKKEPPLMNTGILTVLTKPNAFRIQARGRNEWITLVDPRELGNACISKVVAHRHHFIWKLLRELVRLPAPDFKIFRNLSAFNKLLWTLNVPIIQFKKHKPNKHL